MEESINQLERTKKSIYDLAATEPICVFRFAMHKSQREKKSKKHDVIPTRLIYLITSQPLIYAPCVGIPNGKGHHIQDTECAPT